MGDNSEKIMLSSPQELRRRSQAARCVYNITHSYMFDFIKTGFGRFVSLQPAKRRLGVLYVSGPLFVAARHHNGKTSNRGRTKSCHGVLMINANRTPADWMSLATALSFTVRAGNLTSRLLKKALMQSKLKHLLKLKRLLSARC